MLPGQGCDRRYLVVVSREEGGGRGYNYNYVIDYDSVLPPHSLSIQQIKFQIAVKTIIDKIIFLSKIIVFNFVVFVGIIWKK